MKFYFIIIFIFSISCQNNSINDSYTEDFSVFHKRFYADSLFQKSRIHYPLDGWYRADDMQILKWKKGDIGFLDTLQAEDVSYVNRVLSERGENVYVKNITNKDSIYIEHIYLKNSGFSTERHFKRFNNKWYLIFFKLVSV